MKARFPKRGQIGSGSVGIDGVLVAPVSASWYIDAASFPSPASRSLVRSDHLQQLLLSLYEEHGSLDSCGNDAASLGADGTSSSGSESVPDESSSSVVSGWGCGCGDGNVFT